MWENSGKLRKKLWKNCEKNCEKLRTIANWGKICRKNYNKNVEKYQKNLRKNCGRKFFEKIVKNTYLGSAKI